jgi:hypothetical protein
MNKKLAAAAMSLIAAGGLILRISGPVQAQAGLQFTTQRGRTGRTPRIDKRRRHQTVERPMRAHAWRGVTRPRKVRTTIPTRPTRERLILSNTTSRRTGRETP